MSITDALSRISQIQQELAELSDGTLTGTSASQAASATSSATDTGDSSSTTGTSFADALAQAQDASAATGSSDVATTAASTAASAAASTASPTETGDADFGTDLAGASTSDQLVPASAVTAELAATGGASIGADSTTTVAALGATSATTALPAAAATLLTSNQQQFASTLAADTGLNPGVVSAWVLAEESGAAAQSRQAQSNNDWLNVGYTSGGTYGASDSIWSDPVSAANATAGWLKGQETIPGYGTAGSGIESILETVGQTPGAQMAALQSSGWASSGYPNLPSLYAQVTE
jgi:hypothetical protein